MKRREAILAVLAATFSMISEKPTSANNLQSKDTLISNTFSEIESVIINLDYFIDFEFTYKGKTIKVKPAEIFAALAGKG
jgi:hypothetical protein